jgi:lipopolysaccharide export LptBFGC system permease protein LptF
MLCAWSSQYPHQLLASLFLFQLPDPLLQELPLWFLLGMVLPKNWTGE